MEEIMLLPLFKKAILDYFLRFHISKMTQRTRNGLTKISRTLDSDELYAVIFQQELDFINIWKAKGNAFVELEGLKNKLSAFIQTLGVMGDAELIKTYTKLATSTNSNSYSHNFDDQLEILFDENSKLKLFSFLKFLIDSNAIFREEEKNIFRISYTIKGNRDISMQSIAEEQRLSTDRISQIKIKIETNIIQIFSFIYTLPTNGIVNYGFDGTNPFYVIDDEITTRFNTLENVNFNNKFYGVVFGILVKSSHFLINNDTSNHGKNKEMDLFKYKNYYLIKSSIAEIFPFHHFIKEIFLIQEEKTAQINHVSLKVKITKFLKPTSKQYLNEILPICKLLILKEFDLNLDKYGYIIFERNIKKYLKDLCIEILEDASHTLTLDQIKQTFNVEYPDYKINKHSLRTCISKNKDDFIYIGRSSTYGLKRWETERQNILGGSIRDIAEKYLNREPIPKHISEILKYVLLYRPETKVSALRANLHLESDNRFNFFPGQYIGLKSNFRRDRKFKIKKIIGFHFKLYIFDKMQGWDFNRIVSHFVNEYGYDTTSVIYVINKKIAEGKLNFSEENILL